MDEMVRRAMAKWPEVPAVHGWLSLDRRGRWLLKGEPVENETITAFFGRNYGSDSAGRWYVQNGPQRVFVALAYTPFVYRIEGTPDEPVLRAHTGADGGIPAAAWFDETGAALFDAPPGPGVIDDRDVGRLETMLVDRDGSPMSEDAAAEALDALLAGEHTGLGLRWGARILPLGLLKRNDVPLRFGFSAQPEPS